MIQSLSNPTVQIVYRQTGWQTISKNQVYLHGGGGITAAGNDDSYTVSLPQEIAHYDLSCDEDPQECCLASLDLLNLTDQSITWPLLAATWAPLYGPVDFAVHLTGKTGSFKSELVSLFQAHYGAGFDARTLPGSWSSTPNALEALAYMARNAVFVIDDFIPSGTSAQQRAYQGNADKVFRAQGNQAGRARLTDTTSLQQTMFPRGIIMSTGEDTPEGQSVRARMLILEIAPASIDTSSLTDAQSNRPFYCGSVAWLAQSLASKPANLKPAIATLTKSLKGIGHARTGPMLGRLIAVAQDVLGRMREAGIVSAKVCTLYQAAAQAAMIAAGSLQGAFLEDADPVDTFSQVIRQVMATGGGFFRTQNGGVPAGASLLGWSAVGGFGEMQTFQSRGQQLGWVNVPKNELYLDVLAGYPTIKKAAGSSISLSQGQMLKQMKQSGLITRSDPTRNRNTIRITAEGHPRQVICLSLSDVLDQQEAISVTQTQASGAVSTNSAPPAAPAAPAGDDGSGDDESDDIGGDGDPFPE
jgi:hypothetical protein